MGYVHKEIILPKKSHKLGRSLIKIFNIHKSYLEDYHYVNRITIQIYINSIDISDVKVNYFGTSEFEINHLHIQISEDKNLNGFNKIVDKFTKHLIYSSLFHGITLLKKEKLLSFDTFVSKGCLTEKGRASIGLPKDHLRW